MEEVPDPPLNEHRSISEILFEQISALPSGKAFRVNFEAESHADYVRTKLRAMARKEKRFLSSSRSEDGLTRYFWLEPEV